MLTTILAFLFVFCLVVVVHELGHFFAARACGVRVERFSLGFGPVLASVRDRHGTEWCLSAVPLGGYVKFFGDASAASNPDTSRLEQLRAQLESEHGRAAVEECYHFKPVWQRAIVAAAGPVANLILALVVFTGVVAVMGDSGYPPVVGAVAPDSPAAEAGFEKGDRILEIDGRPVRYYRDIQQFAALAGGDRSTFTVERGGQVRRLDMTIGRRVTTDPFGGESEVGFIGISLGLPAVLADPADDSPAKAAGFEAGDVVVAVDGRPVDYFVDVQQFVEEHGPGPARFLVDRGGNRVTLEPVIAARDEAGLPPTVGIEPDYAADVKGLRIGAVTSGGPAEQAGLEPGDVVVAIAGRSVADVRDYSHALDQARLGKPLSVTYLRGEEQRETMLTPAAEPLYYVGLRADASDVLMVEHFGPLGAISRGLQWTWEAGAAPVRYVARTLTGRESGRELGGFLRIVKVSGSMADQAYDSGGLLNAIIALVTLAGALSVSIGLLNLLPIPILDGGHLLYYAYEAAAGRPLGEGAQEWGFRIGLALVLGLMIFATWNDLRYLRVFEAIGNVLS